MRELTKDEELRVTVGVELAMNDVDMYDSATKVASKEERIAFYTQVAEACAARALGVKREDDEESDADEDEDEDETTYTIVRKYANDYPSEVLETGLTLEEARAHCNDPETSSRTCTSKAGLERTELFGPWFDCYYEED